MKENYMYLLLSRLHDRRENIQSKSHKHQLTTYVLSRHLQNKVKGSQFDREKLYILHNKQAHGSDGERLRAAME